jgi:predicted ABC-type transport system involved in lysophospholipase L1 biosynthesis ATPase subunit
LRPHAGRTQSPRAGETGIGPRRDGRLGRCRRGPARWLAAEPTCNLDKKAAEELFVLQRRLNAQRGTTVLFLTHNLALSERCDMKIEGIDGQSTGD